MSSYPPPQGPYPQGQVPQGTYPPPPGGASPPPSGPYPPPPGPYAPPPTTNSNAVAALVTALTCLFPFGLILGIVALVQISRREGREKGKGMAIAAVSIQGAVAVIALVGLLLGGLAGFGSVERDESGRVKEATDTSAFSVVAGDCFNTGGEVQEESTEQYSVEIVPCDEPHQAEAYDTFDITGEPEYPGDARVAELAEEGCVERDQLVVDAEMPDDLVIATLHPMGVSWSTGDREVVCAYMRDAGTLDRSLLD